MMAVDVPYPGGRKGRRLDHARAAHADKLRHDVKTYRITTTRDGAGVSEVTGDWATLVKAVSDQMKSDVTNDDLIETHEMLMHGVDGGAGWDGASVHLQFEDGSIEVELVNSAPSEAP
jgi:hypothetical protein